MNKTIVPSSSKKTHPVKPFTTTTITEGIRRTPSASKKRSTIIVKKGKA